MATSVADFVGRINSAAQGVGSSNRTALDVVALAAKNTLLAAPGAPKFLRGVGLRGARVGVRYDVFGQTNAVARIRWWGPAHLVNNPTKAHTITPRRRRRALSYGNQAYARVQHPGTRGKRFFQTGAAVVHRTAPEIFQRQVHGELARHFTGG